MTVPELTNEIDQAFGDVSLGDGIGLFESQAIDDYATEKAQQAERSRDERQDWRLIDEGDLSYAHSSLSFVDAKGMAFLLPAYMVASLDRDFGHDPVFHLTQCGYELFIELDHAQKKAVLHYLEWVATNPDYEFDRPHVIKSINEFWSRQIE